MHRGKVNTGVSELLRGNELSRDHVNRPLEMDNGGSRVKNLSLNFESHTHLGVLRKANTKNEHNFGRIVEL